MLYGLAKNQDFYAERVERFVALAPCLVSKLDYSYETAIAQGRLARSLGIYNLNGGDQAEWVEEETCEEYGLCGAIPGEAMSLSSVEYFIQIWQA